jgi:hypothetical protein
VANGVPTGGLPGASCPSRIVQTINVPDRRGRVDDVVLGFRTLQDYVREDSPPVTANGGPYTLNQPRVGPVTYTRPISNGVNILHGGLIVDDRSQWADSGGSGLRSGHSTSTTDFQFSR